MVAASTSVCSIICQIKVTSYVMFVFLFLLKFLVVLNVLASNTLCFIYGCLFEVLRKISSVKCGLMVGFVLTLK